MENNNKKIKITTYDLVSIALMTALCYVGTTYLMFQIPSPLGTMRFHLGDVFCLLAALLFGPLAGGFAGSVGMSLSDLATGYAAYAPSTFVLRLAQGSLCGFIAWRRSKNGCHAPGAARCAIAGGTATAVYIILMLAYHFFEKRYMWGAEMETVLADLALRLGNSSFKALINVAAATLLAPVFRAALKRAGLKTAKL